MECTLVHDYSELGFYPRVLPLQYSILYCVGTLDERLLDGLLHVRALLVDVEMALWVGLDLVMEASLFWCSSLRDMFDMDRGWFM